MLGHRRGIQSVRAVVEEARRLGLEQLTLYCLSVENWKRPERELRFLMRTHDFQEGVQSFVEKRDAVFEGR